MERQIKFRGFNEVRNLWMFGYFFKYPNGRTVIYESDSSCCGVLPSTVGQYTGLKDKKGTKIFEGDIVTIGSDLKAMVIWFNGSFRFQDELSSKATYLDDMGVIMRDYDVAVIGNIHDNPELMKGGE